MRETPLKLVIEDDISLEVARKIVLGTNNNFYIDRVLPDTSRKKSERGLGYIKKRIQAFNNASAYSNFLIITDLDQNECAPVFINDLLGNSRKQGLFLRIAVREIESWIIADRKNFSSYFAISKDIIDKNPESITDPKEYLFQLAKRSRSRNIREGIPPSDATARLGPEYNEILIRFVHERWNFKEALQNSDSLRRFVMQFDNKK
ncbi:MAG: hypothetical protein U5P10_14755 [Spirochaetia bacterium]|nr:hypothetical protein [Spirochaetia bacterium]